MNEVPRFMTIRQTAQTGLVSEHFLRQWQKQNRLPGVWAGNRFLVNFPQLVENLQAASRDPGYRE